MADNLGEEGLGAKFQQNDLIKYRLVILISI